MIEIIVEKEVKQSEAIVEDSEAVVRVVVKAEKKIKEEW